MVKSAWGCRCCDGRRVEAACYLCGCVSVCVCVCLCVSVCVRFCLSTSSFVTYTEPRPLSAAVALLAAGLLATLWLGQSAAIYFKDFKLCRIPVKTSEGSALCCRVAGFGHRQQAASNGGGGVLLHRAGRSTLTKSSRRHSHHLLSRVPQSVMQVWTSVCQTQLGDIHPQGTLGALGPQLHGRSEKYVRLVSRIHLKEKRNAFVHQRKPAARTRRGRNVAFVKSEAEEG